MGYGMPLSILKMTPRERWKEVWYAMRIQHWDNTDYRVWYARYLNALGFEKIWFGVDKYGFRFEGLGEKYFYAKRHGTDNYGYIISRYGVERVND